MSLGVGGVSVDAAFAPSYSSLEDEQGTSESSELTGTRFAKLFHIRINNRLFLSIIGMLSSIIGSFIGIA